MKTAAGVVGGVTFAGREFRASNRTAAHLQFTLDELARRHPGTRLRILQTCFHTGTEASKGTHDKDAVLDVHIEGLTWMQGQRFLRTCGWAAWFRPELHQGGKLIWNDHIHMVSIPSGLDNTPSLGDITTALDRLGIEVGTLIPAQIDDYFAHSMGLKNQHAPGLDHSFFPDDIAATIFDYQEDDMAGFTDWPDDEKKAFGEFIQDQVRATLINVKRGDEMVEKHLGAVLRELEESQDKIREDLAGIKDKVVGGVPA
jgi:hypothetical protein